MMKSLMYRLICLGLALLLPFSALAEVSIIIMDEDGTETRLEESAENAAEASEQAEETGETPETTEEETAEAPSGEPGAREAFIDGIISLAEEKYKEANGRAQRAHYSGDIYVCKNFTVYLFRQNRDGYRMAEFPDTELVIPDNKPKKECKEYYYGCEWVDVPASEGNPFYVAASFRYDTSLSKAENIEKAREFMKNVQRGDYFQMAADYYYGKGAHSLIFIADYDASSNTVHWTDSNMRGQRKNGIRYGFVQFDAEKDIDFFVDAFCLKKHGATLYRLRDDIIRKP